MNSKERVLCSFDWREPDRVPIQIYLTPEMDQKLKEHFKGRDVVESLGVDFRFVGPQYKGKIKPPHNDMYYLKIARKRAIFTLRAVVTPQMRGDKGLTTCVVG